MMIFNKPDILMAALLLGQATYALPNRADTELTVRDDTREPWFQIYGESGKPELKDIEKSVPSAFMIQNAKGSKDWLAILMGFQKCSQGWIMSFFPEKDGDVFPPGQAYTIPFDLKDSKRHEKLVKLNSMDRAKKLMPDVGFEDLEGKPWWQWALLEGAQAFAEDDVEFASDKNELDFRKVITVLSGVNTVVIAGEQLKDHAALWDDVYSKARDSPIWIQTDPGSDDYSVILDRHEEDFDGGQRTGVDARNLETLLLSRGEDQGGVALKQRVYVNDTPKGIVHLAGFPAFNGTAAGIWEKPAEPLKPDEP